LKLLHAGGPLAGNRLLILGASGGDMAMTADVSRDLELDFSSLPQATRADLSGLLTDRVTLANPLDIHTYLWFDPPALQRVFAAIMRAGYDAVGFMLDSPPQDAADTSSFDVVIDAFIAASHGASTRAALIASLPETLSRRIRERCLQGGVIPLQGLRESLEALSLAGAVGAAWRSNTALRLSLPTAYASAEHISSLSEQESKLQLAGFGLQVPRGKAVVAEGAAAAAAELGFPVVIKALGAHLEHKSDLGAVALNLRNPAEAAAAALQLKKLSPTLLVEEMCCDGVAEILIGVIVDAQFGQVLVLGAGGVLTELMADSVSLLPPWTRESIAAGLERLAIARLLVGYRGKAAADVEALIDAVLSVARYAAANLARLMELDVNPVIVRPVGRGAVAVDALIRLRGPNSLEGS
jgi:acetyl-CoA synthetase